MVAVVAVPACDQVLHVWVPWTRYRTPYPEMAAPLSRGAVHVTEIDEAPAESSGAPGGSGDAVEVVMLAALDHAPGPAALAARTRT